MCKYYAMHFICASAQAICIDVKVTSNKMARPAINVIGLRVSDQ